MSIFNLMVLLQVIMDIIFLLPQLNAGQSSERLPPQPGRGPERPPLPGPRQARAQRRSRSLRLPLQVQGQSLLGVHHLRRRTGKHRMSALLSAVGAANQVCEAVGSSSAVHGRLCSWSVSLLQPWCPTRVDRGWHYIPGEWGYCSASCQIEMPECRTVGGPVVS